MESLSQYKYFPVSPTDEKWGIYITTCGHSVIQPGGKYPPELHPEGYHFSWERGRVLHEFCIVYISHGEGVFESESSGSIRVHEGSLFLIHPHERHRYRPERKYGWTEYWLGFAGSHAASIVKNFLPARNPVVNIGLNDDVLGCYLKTLDLATSEPAGFQQIMAGYASTVLAYFYRGMKGRGTGLKEADDIIQRAKCLIIEALTEPLYPKDLAGRLNVSYPWLRRTFKHYTGLPLLQYQMQMRIHKAQSLLLNCNKPIYIISQQCGFESCYYFSRIFKQKTGVTPSAYRKQSQRETSK